MKNLILTIMAMGTLNAQASPNKPKAVVQAAPAPQTHIEVAEPQINRALLQQVYGQATQKLQQVEALVAGNQYGTAYVAAMELMMSVKEKTGINPMAKFRDVIDVSGILSDADLRKPFESLLNWQQEKLAQAVYEYQGGFYIPLLNVVKRARIIYVKAFHQANKSTMLRRDVEKMLRDLIQVHNFSVLIKDTGASDSYMLFDLDVADEDFQYAFDKEIVLVALGLTDLAQTEEGFEASLVQDRNARLIEYNKGLRGAAPAAAPSAGLYTEANFNRCFNYYDVYGDDDNKASSRACESKARSINYGSDAFRKCWNMNDVYGDDDNKSVTEYCEANASRYAFSN